MIGGDRDGFDDGDLLNTADGVTELVGAEDQPVVVGAGGIVKTIVLAEMICCCCDFVVLSSEADVAAAPWQRRKCALNGGGFEIEIHPADLRLVLIGTEEVWA